MPTTRQLSGSTSAGYTQIHVIDPKTTAIAPVAKAGEAFLAEWPKFQKLGRERQAAHVAAQYAKNAAKADARQAGIDGTKYDAKAAKRKRQATKDAAEVADLVWAEAGGRIDRLIADYRAALVANAGPLREEAINEVDEGIRSLTTARMLADKAAAKLQGNLDVLGGLVAVGLGDGFKPTTLKAGGRMNGAPVPYVGHGIEQISEAITLAVQVLNEQRATISALDQAHAEHAASTDEDDDLSDGDEAEAEGWVEDDEEDDDD